MGDDKYVPFSELVKRYGEKIAKSIRAEKRRLQDSEPNALFPCIKSHPDLPDNED